MLFLQDLMSRQLFVDELACAVGSSVYTASLWTSVPCATCSNTKFGFSVDVCLSFMYVF